MNVPVNKKSFLELLKNENYKKELINSLTISLIDDDLKRDLEYNLNYILDKRMDVFDILCGELNNSDESVEVLVLPSVRRAWSMVFINTPTIFGINDKRLELFQLSWDIDNFLNYLKDIFTKVKNCLDQFENLDTSVEILNLICQNYINKLISDCRKNKTKEEIKIEIRDLKLKKMLK
jgi:hypothetical protein